MTFTSMPLPGVVQMETIADWEDVFAQCGFSGVVAGVGNNLAPSLDTGGRNAVINTGNAQVRGFLFENTSSTSTAIPAASGMNRIDRLVLRLNRAASTASTFVVPTVITGTPAASPQEPALVQTTTGLWDLPVCSWTSSSSGALSKLSDERYFGGALLSGVSTARPVMAGPGLLIETDTGKIALWTGSQWQHVGGTPDTWHAFSLQGGFTAQADVNGTPYPPAYRLLPDGNVALQGVLGTPASGSVLAVTFGNVPAGYQPATNVPTATVVTNNGATAGHVYIRPNGAVRLSGGFGNSEYVLLDSILNVWGT